MQFILDHLTAVFVSAIAILILLAMQYRGRDTSIESTQFYASKTRMLDLVQMLERDISNLGSGVDSTKNAIVGFDTTVTPAHFTFRARTSQADPLPHVVRYEWDVTGDTYTNSKGTVPTLTVERLVDGVFTGSSMDTITSFRIDLMSADSSVIGVNFPDTRLVSIGFSAASPLTTGDVIEESRWNKVFRPVNMTRN